MASKIRLIWLDIWMISPLIKHNCGEKATQKLRPKKKAKGA